MRAGVRVAGPIKDAGDVNPVAATVFKRYRKLGAEVVGGSALERRLVASKHGDHFTGVV
jgi:hypothetical protein